MVPILRQRPGLHVIGRAQLALAAIRQIEADNHMVEVAHHAQHKGAAWDEQHSSGAAPAKT